MVGRQLTRRSCALAVALWSAALLAAGPAASGAPGRAAQPAPVEELIPTADGHVVPVRFSAPYATAPDHARSLADMLGDLMHGAEMGSLRISVLTPAEVGATCGPDAWACYGGDRITIPGAQPAGGYPIHYLLAHEYGHHVLAHRRNDPWPADLWGPKHWATALDVCRKVRKHELFLGYSSVPGEAFAETFAMMHAPGLHLPWNYTDLLAPDDAIEAAVRRDVLDPWRGPAKRTVRGHLRAGRSRLLHPSVPLDGRARFELTGARGVELALTSRGRVLKRVRTRAGRARVGSTVCGNRRVGVRLTATGGATPYTLTISRP
jgi:hypothetical protein